MQRFAWMFPILRNLCLYKTGPLWFCQVEFYSCTGRTVSLELKRLGVRALKLPLDRIKGSEEGEGKRSLMVFLPTTSGEKTVFG